MSTPITVTQIIEGSGNNFHAKVARWFNSNGWHTIVSPYYMDQSQSKARELDLIAEKLWPLKNASGHTQGNLVVRLFIECKFVASEAVFWFAPKNAQAAKKLVCSLGPFRENNSFTDKHHYIAKSPSVAKLFASSITKAQENDPFYRALNQALNGTVSMRPTSPAHPAVGGHQRGKVITFNYPVVVCSSFAQLYAVDFFAEAIPSAIADNFQLEVQYAFLDRSDHQQDEYFLIDFVEYDR
ncbi:MAG: hypothetical protein Q6358_02505, partial [Candidatus Brocadiales bacterium]|nr:hypothetical protein [Candidatus Brocadiales bacterium]